MSDRTPSSQTLNSNDLDAILNMYRRELEDSRSVNSGTTSSTVSDLPGPGRALGRLYSFLGRRLEAQLSKLAERLGYTPKAIELRVMARAESLPQDSKGQNKLKKDLKLLLRYTRSVMGSNRVLAYKVITSVALVNPYFRDLLIEIGAARALGIACLLEEESELSDGLLSPSRKALICVVTTELHSIGAKWLVLTHQFRDLGRSCMLEDGRMTGSLSVGEQFFDTHTSCYESLVKYVGQGSPEESWLALRYFAGNMRHRVHHGLGAAIDKRSMPALDKSQLRTSFRRQMDRNHALHMEMIESVYSIVFRVPHYVDWNVIEFALLQLLVQDFVMVKSGISGKCSCTQAIDAIVSKHSEKISSDISARLSSMKALKGGPRRVGNPFMAIEEVLSGRTNFANTSKYGTL